MDARVKTVREILHSGDQYLIPFFQRFYSWDSKNWKRLFDDLTTLAESPQGMHFLGPLVCTQAQHVPGEVTAYQLIDGQQRLTTLALVLIALRNLCREAELEDLAATIHEDFLVHKRKTELQHFKIVPRIGDREALIALIRDDEVGEFKELRLLRGLRYFTRELRRYSADAPQTKLRDLFLAITAQLSLVVITVVGENPYEIFESLNSTGLPLEQSDLIRNFVFMDVPLNSQESFFREHWNPYEAAFEAVELYPAIEVTSFYRNYLMREGQYSKKNETYVDFKARNRERALLPEAQVGELRRFARFQSWLDRPSACRVERLGRWLTDFSMLEAMTATPLVMGLLDRWESNQLSTDDLGQCLADLASFVLRRSITGETTRTYARWFPEAVRSIESDPVEDLRRYWSFRGWPGDDRFIEALVDFQLYRRERSKCRLILNRLEDSYGHKERVDPSALSIEHVMPQTIGPGEGGGSWRAVLGSGWYEFHQQWVHTLGNLTLTGYNPDMSNRDYRSKQTWLASSNLVLNAHFKATDSWGIDEIRARGQRLATEVAKLWANPTSETISTGVAGTPSKPRVEFDIEGLRRLSIERLEASLGCELHREAETKFSTADGSHHIVCVASRPYEHRAGGIGYWFGVSSEHLEFMRVAHVAHIALCCGSPDRILWMTLGEFAPLTTAMHETPNVHWHVQIHWDRSVSLDQPKQAGDGRIDVSKLLFK